MPASGCSKPRNISVGRGTKTPFEIVRAPYVDGRALAAERLPGVRFATTRFRPTAAPFAARSAVAFGWQSRIAAPSDRSYGRRHRTTAPDAVRANVPRPRHGAARERVD